MKHYAKLCLFVLSLVLAFTVSTHTYANAAEKTVTEKVTLLNTLKIISGSNGNYYLNNQLTRSEALAFIIRLIGKGDYVLANKTQYSTTVYTDVPAAQWYAPYVGYGYINGFTSRSTTQYKPLEIINEKEFLKLVLIAMDYREGTDFTDDTIYTTARDLGLISLADYISHYSSNFIPTRTNAVNILYAAITSNSRTGDIMVQKLIEGEVVTRAQILSLGLLVDDTFTAIETAEAVDLSKVEIKFNEPVSSVSEIKVYEQGTSTSLAAQIVSISGNTLTITTPAREASKTYVVELTKVRDISGNIVQTLSKQFTGLVIKEVTSDYFRIRKIEPVNNSSFKVYFTHPLSINSEIGLYYSVVKDSTLIASGTSGDIKAGILNSSKDGLLITLNTVKLEEDALYTLNIDGALLSGYGVKMNSGLGDSMKFVASSDDNAKFELTKIEASDESTLKLTFNREINAFLAAQVYNFYLTDSAQKPVSLTSTNLDSNGQVLYIKVGALLSKDATYYLTINNLNDITKQESITEKSYTFKVSFSSAQAFKISRIQTPNYSTIEVTFNKAPNKDMAVDPAYYTVQGGNGLKYTIDKIFYDPDTDSEKVVLYLNKFNKMSTTIRDYRLRLDYKFEDSLGNKISVMDQDFNGSVDVPKETGISSVVPISADAVKVTFTREIDFSQANLSPSNFTLSYTYFKTPIVKVPVSVYYADAKTLILKFDSLDYKTSYSLKIGEITDYLGITVKGLEKSFETVAQTN